MSYLSQKCACNSAWSTGVYDDKILKVSQQRLMISPMLCQYNWVCWVNNSKFAKVFTKEVNEELKRIESKGTFLQQKKIKLLIDKFSSLFSLNVEIP